MAKKKIFLLTCWSRHLITLSFNFSSFFGSLFLRFLAFASVCHILGATREFTPFTLTHFQAVQSRRGHRSFWIIRKYLWMNDEKTVEALSIASRLVNPLTQNGNKKKQCWEVKNFSSIIHNCSEIFLNICVHASSITAHPNLTQPNAVAASHRSFVKNWSEPYLIQQLN